MNEIKRILARDAEEQATHRLQGGGFARLVVANDDFNRAACSSEVEAYFRKRTKRLQIQSFESHINSFACD